METPPKIKLSDHNQNREVIKWCYNKLTLATVLTIAASIVGGGGLGLF